MPRALAAPGEMMIVARKSTWCDCSSGMLKSPFVLKLKNGILFLLERKTDNL